MVSARNTLWIVVFCGFAVNYINRINVNIAMVRMVEPPKYKMNFTSYCRSEENSTRSQELQTKAEGGFKWDEKEQNLVLGGFYWLHWVLQIPSGIFARSYGTKIVFGLSNFISSLLIFFMPMAAYRDYRILVGLRVLQGFISGLAWPSMHQMFAQWIPPNERSKFVSAYFGSSIGVAVTYPLCGLLMEHLGWESVFHVTGVVGLIWYMTWLYFAYDSPAQHPRIAESERKYIQESLANSYETEKLLVPWKKIMTSGPVWMAVGVQWSAAWGIFTLMTQSPTYFSNIIGLDMTMTGIISGVPHFLRSFFAIAFGIFCDHLITKNLMGQTNVRKMATLISVVGQGIMFLLLPYAACNNAAAIIIFILAVGLHGAVSSGPLCALLDISPNFAGLTQGIAGTGSTMTGGLSAYIVGMLTYQNQTLEQWKKVYFLSAAIMLVTGGIYTFFSSSKVQEWNTPKKKEEGKEMQPLQT